MQGKIVHWVDDRGFGFIQSDNHKGDIFAHISSFNKGYRNLIVGDTVVFQLDNLNKAKVCAKHITLVGVAPMKRAQDRRKLRLPLRYSIVVLVVALLYQYGSQFFKQESTPSQAIQTTDSAHSVGEPSRAKDYENPFKENFKCDGRVYCSQMHSKAEALYFIQNCPNTKMDGDFDGNPCERKFGH